MNLIINQIIHIYKYGTKILDIGSVNIIFIRNLLIHARKVVAHISSY